MTVQVTKMKSGGSQERIPDGTYMGRVVQIVDYGIQATTHWQTGEPGGNKPKGSITFELPTERTIKKDDDGNETSYPRWIGKEVTLSNHKKSALMKMVSTLKPKGISSLDELLDTPCMVNIGSTSGGNAKVVSVVPAPNGMEVQPLENGTAMFDFDAPDTDVFLGLFEWQQTKIKDAVNYNGSLDQV